MYENLAQYGKNNKPTSEYDHKDIQPYRHIYMHAKAVNRQQNNVFVHERSPVVPVQHNLETCTKTSVFSLLNLYAAQLFVLPFPRRRRRQGSGFYIKQHKLCVHICI